MESGHWDKDRRGQDYLKKKNKLEILGHLLTFRSSYLHKKESLKLGRVVSLGEMFAAVLECETMCVCKCRSGSG